jgi:hypothetical protein
VAVGEAAIGWVYWCWKVRPSCFVSMKLNTEVSALRMSKRMIGRTRLGWRVDGSRRTQMIDYILTFARSTGHNRLLLDIS